MPQIPFRMHSEIHPEENLQKTKTPLRDYLSGTVFGCGCRI